MNLQSTQTEGRLTRSNTPKNTGKDKGQTKEELLGARKGAAKNAEGGKAFLEKEGYTVIGQEYTWETLSRTLLLLAQGASHATLVSGARAIALIMMEETRLSESEDITRSIEGTLKEPMELMRTTLMHMNDAASLFSGSATEVNGIMEGFREECHLITKQLSDSAEDLVTELGIAITTPAAELTNRTVRPDVEESETYARAHLPPTHGSNLARNDAKQRQVLIDTAPGIDTNGLASLTEAELVAKGKAALDLMGMEASDAPRGTEFKGARKLKNGGVIYDMDTPAAASWLKSDGVMQSFLTKYGGTSIIKDRSYTVVAEYVPTTVNLETEPHTEYKRIEDANDLRAMSVLSAKWIKPPHRRTQGQRTAHLLIGFKTIEAANTAIRNGLYIAGKRVTNRKLIQEPRRCMKCQGIGGGHLAAECPQVADTCGTCAGAHRTETCQISDSRGYRCANCQTRGHAAWDRTCPAFLSSAARLTERNPDNKYRYFLSDDPSTWEQLHNPPDYVPPQNEPRFAQTRETAEQRGSRLIRTKAPTAPTGQRQPKRGQHEGGRTRDDGWTKVNRRAGRGPGTANAHHTELRDGDAGRGDQEREQSEQTGHSREPFETVRGDAQDDEARNGDSNSRKRGATEGGVRKLTQTSIRNYISNSTSIEAAIEGATQAEETEQHRSEGLREARLELEKARDDLAAAKPPTARTKTNWNNNDNLNPSIIPNTINTNTSSLTDTVTNGNA